MAGDEKLSLKEVSKCMGIKPESIIARHINKEKEPLKAFKIGIRWFVLKSDLKDYLLKGLK
jgi:hypothetical protein